MEAAIDRIMLTYDLLVNRSAAASAEARAKVTDYLAKLMEAGEKDTHRLTVCGLTWFLIERTRLGATLRAATENAQLVQAFGINVPLIVMGTYGAGVALAALAGVLAAPVVQVSPLMGSSLVIVVFAVVVIGGMGSIIGAILSGLVLGLIEGFTKVIYPEASNIVVFVIMAVVLIWRPAGLFGKE